MTKRCWKCDVLAEHTAGLVKVYSKERESYSVENGTEYEEKERWFCLDCLIQKSSRGIKKVVE